MKPNFVFILIDDMGWRDAGCFGSTFYETPNIDRLASKGMKFTNAYAACPVCSPTRASIMTGKYPARLHLTQWLSPPPMKKRLIDAPWIDHLPLEEVTIAEALKSAGYATGLIGKWHLGGEAYSAERQGFDVNIAGSERGSTRSYFSPYQMQNLEDGPEGECLNDRLADEAVRFLRGHKDQPFFLYFAHYAVHTPLQTKEDLRKKYEAKAAALPPTAGPKFIPEGVRQVRQIQDHAVYAGMVQNMDESVGRVLDTLTELGIADNTVVFFMSDNGGLSTSEGAPTSNVPLRGGKGWLYEGGIREPLIVKWPRVTKPGAVCHEPVVSTDFYPTILEMAGLPERPKQHRDGISFASVLKEHGRLRRKAIYWHYPHYSNQGGAPGAAVRYGEYKLIEFFEDHHVELYCLKDDIEERCNLAEIFPDKAKSLQKMLDKWIKSVNGAMPTANPDWKPAAPRQT